MTYVHELGMRVGPLVIVRRSTFTMGGLAVAMSSSRGVPCSVAVGHCTNCAVDRRVWSCSVLTCLGE